MNVIFVNFLAIGDLLITTGSIKAFKNGCPNSRIRVLALSSSAPVLENVPCIDEVIPVKVSSLFGKHKLLKAPWEVLNWRRDRYDMAVSFHVGREPNMLAKTLRAKIKIVPGEGSLKSIVRGDRSTFIKGLNLYTKAYPEIISEALNYCGIDKKSLVNDFFPVLSVSMEEQIAADDLLRDGGAVEKKYIALFPGGGVSHDIEAVGKRYPSYHKVIDLFRQKYPDEKIVLLGNKSDEEPCRKIMSGIKNKSNVIDLHGKTDIRTFASVIGKAKMLVTNDSSALHIGIALRTPTIAIFGPTEPNEMVHPKADVTVVSPGNGKTLYSGKFKGSVDEALATFESITPNLVCDKMYSLIKRIDG